MNHSLATLSPRALWFVAHGHRYYLASIERHKSLIWYISKTGREILRSDVTRWSPWLALVEHSL